MKAVIKNDPGHVPGFLYDVKAINRQTGKVTLCWTTRDYNEITVDIDAVELMAQTVKERVELRIRSSPASIMHAAGEVSPQKAFAILLEELDAFERELRRRLGGE